MKPAKSWFQRLLSRDRRKAERQEAPSLVVYYWDGGAPEAHSIRNISSNGFYLLTDTRWPPGTLVVMTLQMGGGKGAGPQDAGSRLRSIAVRSKVIRLGEDGVGLAFALPEGPRSRSERGPETNGVDRKTLDRFLQRL